MVILYVDRSKNIKTGLETVFSSEVHHFNSVQHSQIIPSFPSFHCFMFSNLSPAC